MPIITYFTPDGDVHTVDVEVGRTIMEGSIRNNLPGIVADCGGNISCATCHVYVDEDDLDRFGELFEEERDMLEFTEHVTDFSRLSCQLVVTSACDGVSVTVPGGNT